MDFLPSLFFGFLTGIGPSELLIIFLVLLLLFGGRKLPELARGLGKSMKEFRNASREIEKDFQVAMDKDSTPISQPNTVNKEVSTQPHQQTQRGS